MNIRFTAKNLILTTIVITMIAATFLIYALAGLSSRPVDFAEPPAFVEKYVAEMSHSDPSSLSKEAEIGDGHLATSKYPKLTADLSNDEALVFNVILDGDSSEVLLRLFAHPEKIQREKVAMAFAAVNVKFSHNEETGFAEKRRKFWLDVEHHLPDIRNALSEALITSAQADKDTRIPYTLAWMPGQGRETLELFVWAAKHHPHPWVRRSSIYFVAKLDRDEGFVGPLLQNRTHDPDYGVRKEVLDLRYKILTGQI